MKLSYINRVLSKRKGRLKEMRFDPQARSPSTAPVLPERVRAGPALEEEEVQIELLRTSQHHSDAHAGKAGDSYGINPLLKFIHGYR